MTKTGINEWKSTVVKGSTSYHLHEDEILDIGYESVKNSYLPRSSIRIIYQCKFRSRRKTPFLTYKDSEYSEKNGEYSKGDSV